MPTTKQRINLTVSREVGSALAHLAKRERVQVATKALSLLTEAIEREEDALWVERADARLKKKGKTKSHKEMMRRYA